MSGGTIVVVPCYNEERRLDVERVVGFARDHHLHVLLVDDGSTDGTRRVLDAAQARAPQQLSALVLPQNGGKAEAVRRGLLLAMDRGAAIVGYLDADLATPPAEMARVLMTLHDPSLQMAIGARVSLLGRRIDRTVSRHYLGRVFASVASAILGLRVYDTQCGAKALRATPALRAALADRFLSRWAFDVELIGRLLANGVDPAAFVEVPLREWQDVKGSKLGPTAMAHAAADLVMIAADLARRRGLNRPAATLQPDR